MNLERRETTGRSIVFTPPAVESFLDRDPSNDFWPEHIARDPTFIKQIESRRLLSARLKEILTLIKDPETSLEEAVNDGRVSETLAVEFYKSLAHLLTDPDYRRIVLYLAFELLPSASWNPSSEELRNVSETLKDRYLSAWRSLHNVHDVRANFVDGDVLELDSRKGDLPRVVKSAHLIPSLVKLGYLDANDAINLIENADNETLAQSVADTLPVLADLGFIGEEVRERMRTSENARIRTFESAFSSQTTPLANSESKAEALSLTSLDHEVQDELIRINEEATPEKGTPKRNAWLKKETEKNILTRAGGRIAKMILGNNLPAEEVASFAKSHNKSTGIIMLIEGIRQAVVATMNTPEQAKGIYNRYRDALIALFNTTDTEAHDSLKRAFYYFRELGLESNDQLEKLSIITPRIEGPFSENAAIMMQEIERAREAVLAIESDSALKKHLYPIVLIFGSRLKGYGTNNADTDTGVFIRPHTPPQEEATIEQSLRTLLKKEPAEDSSLEFWLKETPEGLAVEDLQRENPRAGGPSWTHVLFGAAWEGSPETVREVREKLLVPYLYDSQEVMHGMPARNVYLEELERDTLQYRLMHKGYEQFFPPRGGIQASHAESINSQSIFWDSGFRRVATKLFIERVFLPKIAKKG